MRRFLATSVLLVAARALDALTTWVATRDLTLESNPLTRVLHIGWWGLLLANAAVVGLLVAAAWNAAFAPPSLPSESGLDFHAFVARYWFARPGRRSLLHAMLYLPADARVRRAFIGGPGVVLVIVASAVASIWNLLVAWHVVDGPAAGRIGLAAFWIGLAIGLVLAVRVFLTRAYARYTRAAGAAAASSHAPASP
jgi:hypothetical protein